jgi:hypothetical protein
VPPAWWIATRYMAMEKMMRRLRQSTGEMLDAIRADLKPSDFSKIMRSSEAAVLFLRTPSAGRAFPRVA